MSEDTITTITTTPNIEELQAKCFTTITELFEKYKDHEYMLQRINTHIVNYLPNSLSNECKIYEDYHKCVCRYNNPLIKCKSKMHDCNCNKNPTHICLSK